MHRSQFFGRSVSCGSGRRHAVALTFDDGPSPGTHELADYLADEGIRATFFLCGINVLRYPEIAKRLRHEGHELANHTFSHRRLCPRLGWRLNLLRPRTVRQEVERAQQAIADVTGCTPRLLRAPYGLRWFGLREVQRRLGLRHVLWTAIGHDWEWPAQRVAAHLLARARPGAIFCLHDGRDTRPAPDISVTLEAVRLLVPELKRRGYNFETATELVQEGKVGTSASRVAP